MAAAPRPRDQRLARCRKRSAGSSRSGSRPWLVITAATWVCRWPPEPSPIGLRQPWRHHASSVAPSSGPLDWWVLVAPASGCPRVEILGKRCADPVGRSWRFRSHAAAACTRITHGRFRRLVPAGRRVTRTAHWARAVDLRSLRGRPGRGGVFLLGRHGRRMLVTQPETSVLVIGPTRSGKTVGTCHPEPLRVGRPCNRNKHEERTRRHHRRAPAGVRAGLRVRPDRGDRRGSRPVGDMVANRRMRRSRSCVDGCVVVVRIAAAGRRSR